MEILGIERKILDHVFALGKCKLENLTVLSKGCEEIDPAVSSLAEKGLLKIGALGKEVWLTREGSSFLLWIHTKEWQKANSEK